MTLYSVQVAKPMPYRIPTERIISLEDELTFKKMYKQKDMIHHEWQQTQKIGMLASLRHELVEHCERDYKINIL